MKKFFLSIALWTVIPVTNAQVTDTFDVFFPTGKSVITSSAEQHIRQLIEKKDISLSDRLVVLGYADQVGSNKYNDTLSRLRAQRVIELLVKLGMVKEHQLGYWQGRNSPRRREGARGRPESADRS